MLKLVGIYYWVELALVALVEFVILPFADDGTAPGEAWGIDPGGGIVPGGGESGCALTELIVYRAVTDVANNIIAVSTNNSCFLIRNEIAKCDI